MGVKIFAAVVMTVCFINVTTCVPLGTKNTTESSVDTTEDPCKIAELSEIPKCEASDKACVETSEKKRIKRKTLCESNPNCSYCGSPLPEDYDDDEIGDVVEPIAVENSKDDDDEEKKLVERNIIIENDNETQYYRGFIESGSGGITTVIRLTNMINNTNIINMPTTLNNTNVNNIHIYQNTTSEEGGKFGLGFNDSGSCCYEVLPKNCKYSTAGPKCRSKRRKVCGRQCTRKVINGKKSTCSYTPQWPFVSCPQNRNHQPTFYQGYYPQPSYYPQSGYYPQSEYEFEDEDEPLFPDDEELENPESGWVVGLEKCKIVSEDGLQIFNCTGKGVEFDHPFAKNTDSAPIKRNVRHAQYPGAPVYQNQMMPQQMMPQQMMPQQMMQPQMPFMYPVMYQPVYMQPAFMPQYSPQYFAPPQQSYNNYQPQQIPLPPVDDAYLEYDSEEVHTYAKPKRHVKKHHPVMMDSDDEL